MHYITRPCPNNSWTQNTSANDDAAAGGGGAYDNDDGQSQNEGHIVFQTTEISWKAHIHIQLLFPNKNPPIL